VTAIGIDYFFGQTRTIKSAAVGNRASKTINLERRHQEITLANGQVISVADVPNFIFCLLFPFRCRHQTGFFVGQINARLITESEQIKIFYHPIDSQTLKIAIAAANIIKKSIDFKYNENNLIKEALLKGQIQFNNNNFSGNFNIRLVAELKKLGANYDKKTGNYNISLINLPYDIQSTIAISQNKFRQLNENILEYIDGLNDEKITNSLDVIDFNQSYTKIIGNLENQFKITSDGIIDYNINQKIADNLAIDYTNNLNLYIRNFTDENIFNLREKVYQNTFDGYRAEKLIDIIKSNYNVSQNKAKFLARQETNLLTAKFRQERYTDSGVNKYKWRIRGFHTRPDHERLNNKIFTWDNPPITNRETGERNHPGEDYNCFCLAIPIVEF